MNAQYRSSAERRVGPPDYAGTAGVEPVWGMTTPYSQVRNRSEAQALWAGALEDQEHEIHRVLRDAPPGDTRIAELKEALETARIVLEAQT